MRRTLLTAIALTFLLSLAGCVRPEVTPERALKAVDTPPLFDDADLEPFVAAVESHASVLERRPDRELSFGPLTFGAADYARALRRFVELYREAPHRGAFLERVSAEFLFMRAVGSAGDDLVLVTGYFEPLLDGSRGRTGTRSRALYEAPPDLIALDLSRFDDKFKGERELRGRIDGKRFVPYYSREEIDSSGALERRGLELCWVDPIDAFFLQIQGSGTVRLEDGSEMILNYADKNGHRYEAIGKFLRDEIAPLPITMQTIRNHLRGLPDDERERIFNMNPSYVFFRESDRRAVTASGLPATAGRTIATDRKFFPKGGLAFLAVRPGEAGRDTPAISRFVIDQDVGGAIKGPGRVDLFVGRGEEAAELAGALQSRAELYYLVPRTAVPCRRSC